MDCQVIEVILASLDQPVPWDLQDNLGQQGLRVRMGKMAILEVQDLTVYLEIVVHKGQLEHLVIRDLLDLLVKGVLLVKMGLEEIRAS